MANTEPAATLPPNDPRVVMAAERTLLAWIRTGVALMGFGFVVARFGLFLHELEAARAGSAPNVGPRTGWSLAIGAGLIALGIVTNLWAARSYHRFFRRIDLLESIAPRTWPLSIGVALLLGVLGILLAISLLRLAV
jgi:putative membrane protein